MRQNVLTISFISRNLNLFHFLKSIASSGWLNNWHYCEVLLQSSSKTKPGTVLPSGDINRQLIFPNCKAVH